MAEGNREDDSNPFSYHNFSRKDKNDSEDSDGTEDSYVRPDLGIGNEPSFEKKSEGTSDQPKREENPFSFKHFLCSETGNTYQNTGARPKVYNDSYSHMNTPDSEHAPSLRTPRRIGTPELTSVLPDFVQDHLVIEQCYNLNHSDAPPNLDNLPDFALNSSEMSGRSRLWDKPRNLAPNALEGDNLCLSNHQSSPLDMAFPQSLSGLPFDLPLVGEINDIASPCQPGEVGVSKSLPDFLSDGPIHSSLQPNVQSPDSDGPNVAVTNEVERLKRELDLVRRQLADKTGRIQMLEKELHSIRIRDQEEFGILEKAIEQVEDNLKRSTRRAVTAENNVSKLKQENKSLTNELTSLRLESRNHRLAQAGGSSSSLSSPSDELHSQRLAQDLRQAASSAEQSLRTLISGVGNLRSIAAAIETMHRCQERNEENDPDDETGPGV